MKAQQLQSLDGPDGLHPVEIPAPADTDRVLIEVRAAGVTFPDLLTSQGRYQEHPDLPYVPGANVAGIVLAAPADSGFESGDRVCACVFVGGWAEQVAAATNLTFPLADELDFAEGAALVVNHAVAHFCLHRRGRLRRGEWLLVHGAAGGLGSACVQVGEALGARTIAVVSSEAKRKLAEAAGASATIILHDDWAAEARELTGGAGVDIVLDVVGGDRFRDSLRCLALAGRLVVAGFADGEIPEVKVNHLLLKNVEVIGAAWGAWTVRDPEMPSVGAAALAQLVAERGMRPIVGKRLPLAEAARAMRMLEDRSALGSIIIEP
jgi:NADPH:quinone reductase